MNYVFALVPICLMTAVIFFKFAYDEYKDKNYCGSGFMVFFGAVSVVDACCMIGRII